MTCRACHLQAVERKSANGLCLGHALLYLLGPWSTVEQFILTRTSHAPRPRVECGAREEA
jgi:hypothetical protein